MQRFENDTDATYKQRLKTQTNKTEEEIDQKVADSNKDQDVDQIDDRIETEEISEKYNIVLKSLRERLDNLGLKDVGIKLDNKLRASLNIIRDGDQAYYNSDATKGARGVYDAPLNKIILATTKFDPNNEMTTAEFEAQVKGTMDHEIIHALVQSGIMKESEFQQLLKDGRRELAKIKYPKSIIVDKKPKMVSELERIELLYADQVQSRIDEEIVAEFFRISINENQRLAPKSKTIIGKIIDTFRSVSRAIFDGFGRSSQDIIQDIENGNIGSRERNQSLNMQSYRYIKRKTNKN